MAYDSIHLAHVADVLEDQDHTLGYDEAADRAAGLLGKSMALRLAAQRYTDGKASGDELRRAVRHALAL